MPLTDFAEISRMGYKQTDVVCLNIKFKAVDVQDNMIKEFFDFYSTELKRNDKMCVTYDTTSIGILNLNMLKLFTENEKNFQALDAISDRKVLSVGIIMGANKFVEGIVQAIVGRRKTKFPVEVFSETGDAVKFLKQILQKYEGKKCK